MKRTMVLRLAAAMSLAFLSATGFASCDVDDEPDPVTACQPPVRLLHVSGLHAQLQALPDAVAAGFDWTVLTQGVWPPFREQDLPLMRQVVIRAFDEQQLSLAVSRGLATELEPGQVQSLLHYFDSSVGRQIRDAEMRHSLIYHAEAFAAWLLDSGGYGSQPIGRQLIISDLERALMASRAAVDTVINMQVALQAGLTPALPETQRLDLRTLLKQAESARTDLEIHYRENTLHSLAFIYRELPDGVLLEHASQLRSEAGRRFVQAVNRGLNKGMLQAAESLGVGLQPILHQRLGREV